ncbi:hypothetical protein SAMN05444369_104100 [Capnocytophaga haemolytica]|jgi:hypothetical protein|uniref:Uncharacterized protein n=1 Tax=Capnocytophaga haemolytica TaxID=45243 RepID=A0AAX2H1G0_9FLAO|nr:hypothetical protein SAMN05444369_104100 [Capnocytophaga haemolytica]SNV16582.1 Uncharacterised protein [Capnocytophaga haemolytica]
MRNEALHVQTHFNPKNNFDKQPLGLQKSITFAKVKNL